MVMDVLMDVLCCKRRDSVLRSNQIPRYENANNDNDYYVIPTGTMCTSHVVVLGWEFDTVELYFIICIAD